MNRDILNEEIRKIINTIKKELPIKRKLESLIIKLERDIINGVSVGEDKEEEISELNRLYSLQKKLLYTSLLRDLSTTLRAIEVKNRIQNVGVQQEFIFTPADEMEQELMNNWGATS